MKGRVIERRGRKEQTTPRGRGEGEGGGTPPTALPLPEGEERGRVEGFHPPLSHSHSPE